MGSKSVHEAFEFQTDFAKSAFESYVAELTKISELVTAATKDSFRAASRAACRLGWTWCRAAAPPKSRSVTNIAKGPGLCPGPFCFAAAGLNFLTR